MANDYFQFQQFTIRQARCAMKVGTDGTLLGAWAYGGRRILDVGTGTGLIALMMAQRFPEALVTGIDINAEAVAQAQENVAASPFASHVKILLRDMAELEGEFDSIVSNPPYFTDALRCPDVQRTMARHTDTLTYAQLMHHAWRLLSDEGVLSVVVPADCKSRMESEAALASFFKCHECAIKTTEKKPAKRYLLAFTKHQHDLSQTTLTLGTPDAIALTNDFYIKKPHEGETS